MLGVEGEEDVERARQARVRAVGGGRARVQHEQEVFSVGEALVGLGGGPARGAVDEGQTPEDAALWAAMPQTVKDAVTKSPAGIQLEASARGRAPRTACLHVLHVKHVCNQAGTHV